MAKTNFPNGISAGGTSFAMGTASITGTGNVYTGLTTVLGADAAFVSNPAGTAGGTAVFVSAGASSGGSIIINTYQYTYAAGTVAQSVFWQAFGTE